jgi:hypothetical protein
MFFITFFITIKVYIYDSLKKIIKLIRKTTITILDLYFCRILRVFLFIMSEINTPVFY